MNQTAEPPTPPIAYQPLPAELSEGPWEKLVIATLLAVAFTFIAAGFYASGM